MHFMPAAARGFRQGIIDAIGLNPYKAVFALIMIGSVVAIVFGWKAAIPSLIYAPPAWAGKVTFALLLIAAILFVAPYPPNNIRRLIRHPQLTGVMAWGVGHLLSNGDSRSLVLFAGMLAWAIAQVVLLNRRDGAWTPPVRVPFSRDIILILAGSAAYVLILFSHRFLSGVPLLNY
jgi:uncharacterized membrane protein